tara:strand:+ start:90 stop:311 length:222 start_codon:yes stop_codon:yes gene_type:complete
MEKSRDSVEYIKSESGRILPMVIRDDFNDYEKFPPFLKSGSEKEHLAKAYSGQDFESERKTKAHVTSDESLCK